MKFAYTATFADGQTITRTSARAYTAAWRVVYTQPVERLDGPTMRLMESGFSGTPALAQKSASTFYAWAATNRVQEWVPVQATLKVKGTKIVLAIDHRADGQTRLIVTDAGVQKSDVLVPTADFLKHLDLFLASAQGQAAPSVKPLTPDQADGGARFEARQNAGIDY